MQTPPPRQEIQKQKIPKDLSKANEIFSGEIDTTQKEEEAIKPIPSEIQTANTKTFLSDNDDDDFFNIVSQNVSSKDIDEPIYSSQITEEKHFLSSSDMSYDIDEEEDDDDILFKILDDVERKFANIPKVSHQKKFLSDDDDDDSIISQSPPVNLCEVVPQENIQPLPLLADTNDTEINFENIIEINPMNDFNISGYIGMLQLTTASA